MHSLLILKYQEGKYAYFSKCWIFLSELWIMKLQRIGEQTATADSVSLAHMIYLMNNIWWSGAKWHLTNN